MSYKSIVLVVVLATALFAQSVYAQGFTGLLPDDLKEQFESLPKEEQERIIKQGPPSLAKGGSHIPNTVDCFEYYKFNSVQVDISPSLTNVVAGVPIGFNGAIKNENPYPVVEGQVYAKVFYVGDSTSNDASIRQNGHQLVDQFIVKDGVVLGGNESENISFEWRVPKRAQSGQYEIVMYFTSAYRFNLLGLSFTDDVGGNKAQFTVEGTGKAPVYFDKDSVLLNTTPFKFAAFPPHFSKDDSVSFTATLVNPKAEKAVVSVSWKVYEWDAMLDSHRVNEFREDYQLEPSEKKVITKTVPTIDTSVTYVVVEAVEGGHKSILDVRFIRDGIEDVRINFPAVSSWPLKKGEPVGLFSCLHSTNMPLVPDNSLSLTLSDSMGNTLHTYTYEGDVSGDMMGVLDTYRPDNDVSDFTLTATLRHRGEIIDQVAMKYECESIDRNLCVKEIQKIDSNEKPDQSSGIVLKIVIALGIIVGVGILLWVYRKYKLPKDTSKEDATSTEN